MAWPLVRAGSKEAAGEINHLVQEMMKLCEWPEGAPRGVDIIVCHLEQGEWGRSYLEMWPLDRPLILLDVSCFHAGRVKEALIHELIHLALRHGNHDAEFLRRIREAGLDPTEHAG